MRIVTVGAATSPHALARSAAVASRGHQVRFVTVGDLPLDTACPFEIRTRPMPGNLAAASVATWNFLRDIRSFAPDLLHLHYAGSPLGTLACLSGVHPLVVTVMGGDVLPEQHPEGLSVRQRRATRRILEEADAILVKSDALRPALERLGDFAGRTHTVRWGVDPSVFRRDGPGAASLRERLALDARDRVILSPRHLRPLYNVHLMIEALPAVLAVVPEAVLVLTEGNAEAAYRRLLQVRADTLGVRDRVRFLPHVPAAQMPCLYSLAEVMVTVAASDGLPQSLFESMACGTPVVLGRLPGYAEVVTEGEHALLCDLEPASIAAALVEVLRGTEAARARAARALAQVQAVASLPRDLDRLEALYADLVAARRPRRLRPAFALDLLSLLLR